MESWKFLGIASFLFMFSVCIAFVPPLAMVCFSISIVLYIIAAILHVIERPEREHREELKTSVKEFIEISADLAMKLVISNMVTARIEGVEKMIRAISEDLFGHEGADWVSFYYRELISRESNPESEEEYSEEDYFGGEL